MSPRSALIFAAVASTACPQPDALEVKDGCTRTSDCPLETVCDFRVGVCVDEEPGFLTGNFDCSLFPAPVTDEGVRHDGISDVVGTFVEEDGFLEHFAFIAESHCFFSGDAFWFTAHDLGAYGAEDSFQLFVEVPAGQVESIEPGGSTPIGQVVVTRRGHVVPGAFEHAEATRGAIEFDARPDPDTLDDVHGELVIEDLVRCPDDDCRATPPL